MVSFRNALCLALLVPAAAQEAAGVAEAEPTEEVETEDMEMEIVDIGPPVCEGAVLASVSNGCITSEICGTMAQGMGLQLGNELYPFEADYVDKGCFYYPDNHPEYPSQAFFGTGGTCSQLRIRPSAGGEHLSCDGRTQAPFDANRCEGDLCITPEACQATAAAMGLQLGNSLYPFQGPWVVKGCVYFPSNHPEFPNQAYFGRGADICGQLRASPNDGSVRISCVAGAENLVAQDVEPEAVETEAPTEVDAETAAMVANVTEAVVEEVEEIVTETEETASPTQMATAAVPAVAPLPAPVPAPVLNTTSEVAEDEDDKEDKDEDEEEEEVEEDKNDEEEEEEVSDAPQPAATPNAEEEVGEAPAITPAEANVQDKNQKTTDDKNDKDTNLAEEEEDQDEFDNGPGMTVSKLESGSVSSGSVITYAASFGALVMAFFL